MYVCMYIYILYILYDIIYIYQTPTNIQMHQAHESFHLSATSTMLQSFTSHGSRFPDCETWRPGRRTAGFELFLASFL